MLLEAKRRNILHVHKHEEEEENDKLHVVDAVPKSVAAASLLSDLRLRAYARALLLVLQLYFSR